MEPTKREKENRLKLEEKKPLANAKIIKHPEKIKNKECKWMKEVNSQSLQESILRLEKAYARFFKKLGNFPTRSKLWFYSGSFTDN